MVKEFLLDLIWFEPLGVILFLGSLIFFIWNGWVGFIIGSIFLILLVIREEIIFREIKKHHKK
jgi:hypothetical protein